MTSSLAYDVIIKKKLKYFQHMLVIPQINPWDKTNVYLTIPNGCDHWYSQVNGCNQLTACETKQLLLTLNCCSSMALWANSRSLQKNIFPGPSGVFGRKKILRNIGAYTETMKDTIFSTFTCWVPSRRCRSNRYRRRYPLAVVHHLKERKNLVNAMCCPLPTYQHMCCVNSCIDSCFKM